MKILANDGISQAGIKDLEKAGFTVITENVKQENLIDYINQNAISALLVRSATTVRKNLIDACSPIKLIGRGGVGMDNIDVEYAKSKGVEVINTPASSSQSVAELVFAHLFGIARFVYDANRQMPLIGQNNFKDLKKKYAKGVELRDKTIGIIGFGRIGQNVAKYALGCGMKVIAHDPFLERATIEFMINGSSKVSVGIATISMNELLKQSDFISCHMPKQADGKAVINAEQFAQMKDGVRIVNAARGGVVNEKDLLEALNSGKVAHAALDVYENEPTPAEAILNHPKISLTPHIGAATMEAQERIGIELAAQITKFFKTVNA